MDELDGHDRQILQLLGADGRMSYTELAKNTGLSTSAAHQRVRRLEQRGVITSYRAVIDLESVGLPMTAFVSVSPIDASDPDDIPDRVGHLAAVESCYSVAGDHNYVLKVRVGSPVALEQLLADLRASGHVTTNTTVVLSIPYENRPPSVDAGDVSPSGVAAPGSGEGVQDPAASS
ncbi:MAG: Lrp/AsnC family transcriptional regulator [Actinomycetes bacterium]